MGFHRPRRRALVLVSAWRGRLLKRGGRVTPARRGEKTPHHYWEMSQHNTQGGGGVNLSGDARVFVSLALYSVSTSFCLSQDKKTQ